MREQEVRARDKKVQKMTRDGLVEENRTRKTAERISSREADTAFREAEEIPEGEEDLENPEIAAGQRSAMRGAGDKPVVRERAGRKEEREAAPSDRRKRRSYRRNADKGVEPSSAERKQERYRKEAESFFPDRQDAGGKKDCFLPEDHGKPTERNTRCRLRYLPEELPPGTGQAREEAAQDTDKPGRAGYQRTRRQAGERLAEARAEVPPRAGSPPQRHSAQEKRKAAGRLRFEQREQSGQLTGRERSMPGRAVEEMARGRIYRECGETEDENLGVETARKTEKTAAGVREISGQHRRRMREKPYRAAGSAERRLQKMGVEPEYRRVVQADPELQKKALSRWVQKQRIRRKYAAAARESAKGAAHTANVLNKSGQVVRAAAKAAPKKTIFGLASAVTVFVAVLGVLLTSCSSMLTGVQSAVIATCYVAEEEPINQSDLYYSGMETDLQFSIGRTEQDFPGYDEYLYNVGEISHNPYELLGYLSAAYDDFTYAQVKAELERLFGLQYRLSREETVETRIREDENGEEEEYEWRILKTTLTVRPLSEIIAVSLAPGEQADRYGVYMQTCGNRQCYGNPFDFPWISMVTSAYGYRISPITGRKELHRGVDIGAAEGTPVRAVQDGRVVSAGYDGGYGLCVVIEDDNGYQSRYAHCAGVHVSAGQEVERGTQIAAVGSTGSSTGAHLHLEVLHNGAYLNPYFFVDSGGEGYRTDGTVAGEPEFPDNPGAAMGNGSFAAMLEEAEKYLGYPYVWGGSSPPTFDCSGFVSWVVNQSGAGSVGRQTAQGLYNLCTPVSKNSLRPGDLVFFTGTYSSANPVTHVGIYVGGGRMIHAGDPISYANINSSYWTGHFYSGGRLP